MHLVADGAEALHLDLAVPRFHHEVHYLVGGAPLLAAGVEAGGRLDEVGAGVYGAAGAALDLLGGEGVGLDDDLHHDALGVAGIHHGADVLGDVVQVARAQAAVVGHDIQVLDVIAVHDGLGLGHLGLSGAGAKGKVAHYAKAGVGAPHHGSNDGQAGGVDADGGTSVIDALLGVLLDVFDGELGLEDRLIDVGSELGTGHLRSGLGGDHGIPFWKGF